MTLLFQYIFFKAIHVAAVLLLILIGAIWLTQSLRFIEVIVNHNVNLGGYFSLVVYLIPDLVALVMPICLLISGIQLFHKMKSDHELHVLRALGLSNLRISGPLILLSLIFMITIYWINIFVMPRSFKNFRDQEYAIRNQFSSALIREGSFNFMKGMTVFIKERTYDGELKEVFIFKPSSHAGNVGKSTTILAESGEFYKSGDQYAMVLKHGTRQEKDSSTHNINFFGFDEFVYDFSKALHRQEARAVKPYEKSLTELFSATNAQYDTASLGRMRTEGHQRLLTPWLAVVDALLVCAFMLRQSMRRKNNRFVISLVALSGLLVHVGVIAVLNLSARHPNLIYTLYAGIPLLIILLLCVLEWKRLMFHWRKP
jgi:lipopolysaccharide export system permease protein